MNDEYKFNYSYSAPNESERREIESIKKQYISAPKKEDKLERLRDLNKRVMQPPLIISLTIGIVGTLVMGVGLTMVLEWNIVAWGSDDRDTRSGNRRLGLSDLQSNFKSQ